MRHTKGGNKMEYPIGEHAHSINNVPGRMFTIHAPQDVRGNRVHRNQTWKSEGRPVKGYGTSGMMYVNIRFDDECKNGHQSFSITAGIYTVESRKQRDIAAGGCLHDEITKVFPELVPFIKWHLVSTDGPLHYIANTTYHASNRDHNGLLKGESRQIKNGKTGALCWILETVPADLPKYVNADECPTAQVIIKYAPWLRVGEGKERDLDAARSCAIWPDATAEQLSDKEALAARLPALIAEFKQVVTEAGFLWEPVTPNVDQGDK